MWIKEQQRWLHDSGRWINMFKIVDRYRDRDIRVVDSGIRWAKRVWDKKLWANCTIKFPAKNRSKAKSIIDKHLDLNKKIPWLEKVER